MQEQIKETQQALDLALKDMKPCLDHSPAGMLELLKRPSTDYEAAARAAIHKQHLEAATMASHSLTTTIPAQDLQAFN